MTPTLPLWRITAETRVVVRSTDSAGPAIAVFMDLWDWEPLDYWWGAET